MAQYEITVLYHPDLEMDLDKATKKIEGIVTTNSGAITKTDTWGKRKLAYQIAKQDYAVYVCYTVELEPADVKKINDTLNITDEVLRFLIVRPDLKAVAKAEAMRADKAAKLAARGDQEDDRERDHDRGERSDRDDRNSSKNEE